MRRYVGEGVGTAVGWYVGDDGLTVGTAVGRYVAEGVGTAVGRYVGDVGLAV